MRGVPQGLHVSPHASPKEARLEPMEQDQNPLPHARVDQALPVDPAILQRIIGDLSPLSNAARQRLIDTVCTFFGIAVERPEVPPVASNRPSMPNREPTFRFSE